MRRGIDSTGVDPHSLPLGGAQAPEPADRRVVVVIARIGGSQARVVEQATEDLSLSRKSATEPYASGFKNALTLMP
jgi:hypothetical protein